MFRIKPASFFSAARFVRFQSTAATNTSDVFIERLSGSDAGIVIVNLNRAAGKNSLSRNMLSQFRQALQDLQFDQSARVVLLQSTVPGVFCAGADLKERATMNASEVGGFVAGLRSAMSSLANLPQPTIAVLEGAALGGGLEMALACDMRVASPTATLGLVETALAIIPGAGGTQRLARLVGAAKAKELIFTARKFNGNEALQQGVVNYVSSPALDKALNLAREILPQGPIALRMAKKAIDMGSELDIASGLSVEELCYAQVIPTKDRVEGLTAFKEKRKPVYRGE